MDSRRQQKVASLLKETMSEILQREGGNIYGYKALVTITEARITPDLSVARFYVSAFNTDNKELIVQQLELHKSELRRSLGNKLRNRLRKVPELEFYGDELTDEVIKVNELLRKIDKPGTDEEE